MRTMYPVPVPEMDSSDWQALGSCAVDLEYGSAGKHFESFVAGLKLGVDS
jgi:hypothetical protein